MLATVVADLVAGALMQRQHHDGEAARAAGLRVHTDYEVDPFRTVLVSEIMTTTVETLPGDRDRRRRACTGSLTRGHGAYPIVDGDRRCVGIVSRRRPPARDDDADAKPVLDHASRDVVTVRPDDVAVTALRTHGARKASSTCRCVDDGASSASARAPTCSASEPGSSNSKPTRPGGDSCRFRGGRQTGTGQRRRQGPDLSNIRCPRSRRSVLLSHNARSITPRPRSGAGYG